MRSIRGAIRRLQEATTAARELNADRRATSAMLTAWEHGEPVRTAGELATLVAAQRQPHPVPRAHARMRADEEAWGGRGPSESYEAWLAEGRIADAEAGR
jgi:hypothetical protein